MIRPRYFLFNKKKGQKKLQKTKIYYFILNLKIGRNKEKGNTGQKQIGFKYASKGHLTIVQDHGEFLWRNIL